jgi:hypothetical protein
MPFINRSSKEIEDELRLGHRTMTDSKFTALLSMFKLKVQEETKAIYDDLEVVRKRINV